MKLRIRGNSIRIRLMQDEVQTLASSGMIGETTHFPGNQSLSYSVGTASDDEADVRFEMNIIKVRLPKEQIQSWSTSEEVGIYFDVEMDSSTMLQVKVEKDYACLTVREGEDDSKAFPNPNETC